MKGVNPVTFTVTGRTSLTAYVYRDQRKNSNAIVIGISPHINLLPYERQHDVGEDLLRCEAEKVALGMAAKLSGMDENDLMVDRQNQGVGTVHIVPRKGKRYPAEEK